MYPFLGDKYGGCHWIQYIVLKLSIGEEFISKFFFLNYKHIFIYTDK